MTTLQAVKRVQSRLMRLKQLRAGCILTAAAGITAGSALFTARWSPALAAAFACVCAVITAVYAWRTRLFVAPTMSDAAQLLDNKLALKDRSSAVLALSENSSAGEDRGRRDYIESQLVAVVASLDERALVPLEISRREAGAVATGLLVLIAALSMLPSRESAPVDTAARAAVREVLQQNPDLPEPLKERLQELEQTLAEHALNDEAVRAALARAEEELDSAQQQLAEGSQRQGSSLSSSFRPERAASDAISSDSSAQQSDASSSASRAVSSSSGASSSNPGVSSQSSSEKEKNEQPTPNSQDEKQPQDQKQQGNQQEQNQGGKKGSQGDQSEKNPAGAAQKQQDGNNGQKQQGQGEGDGSGASGAGQEGDGESGSQGGAQGKSGSSAGKSQGDQQGAQQGENSEGKEGASGNATGANSSGGKESGASGSSGATTSQGSQGEGSNQGSSQSGLDQTREVLNNLKQRGDPPTNQNADNNKQGQGGKESQRQNSASTGSEGNTRGSSSAGSQPGESGEGKKGAPSSAPSHSNASAKGDSDRSSAAQSSQQQAKGSLSSSPTRTSGNDSPNSQGSTSGSDGGALPNRSEGVREMPEGEGPDQGEGLGGEKAFQEQQIKGDNEQFDDRFTEDQGQVVKNDQQAKSKTDLKQIELARPESIQERGKQRIPLEYRDILEGER